MTLIASFLINNVPVLIGDLLISHERGGQAVDVSIPSWHEANQFIQDEGPVRIINLYQKLNLISDNVCIAWSGSLIQAKTLIKHLRSEIQSRDINYIEYSRMLAEYSKEDTSDLTIISHFVENGILKRDHLGAPPFPYDGLEVQVAGSGASYFLEAIQYTITPEPSDANSLDLNHVVGPALTFVATAFGNQILTGDGVAEGWGGGFEIAFLMNGKFKKLSNVMFLYWYAQEMIDGAINISEVPMFVKTEYLGHNLSVFVCDGRDKISIPRHYLISPVFDSSAPSTPSHPSLDFDWLVNYVHIDHADGQSSAMSRVEHYNGVEAPVTVIKEGKEYKVGFKKSYLESLFKDVNKR